MPVRSFGSLGLRRCLMRRIYRQFGAAMKHDQEREREKGKENTPKGKLIYSDWVWNDDRLFDHSIGHKSRPNDRNAACLVPTTRTDCQRKRKTLLQMRSILLFPFWSHVLFCSVLMDLLAICAIWVRGFICSEACWKPIRLEVNYLLSVQ